jgi:hypothetical protein
MPIQYSTDLMVCDSPIKSWKDLSQKICYTLRLFHVLQTVKISDSRVEFLLCNLDEYEKASIFVPRAIPSSVDFFKGEALLNYCKSKYRYLCRNCQAQVRCIILINEKRGPSLKFEIVDPDKTLASPSYIALGYVWGRLEAKETLTL